MRVHITTANNIPAKCWLETDPDDGVLFKYHARSSRVVPGWLWDGSEPVDVYVADFMDADTYQGGYHSGRHEGEDGLGYHPEFFQGLSRLGYTDGYNNAIDKETGGGTLRIYARVVNKRVTSVWPAHWPDEATVPPEARVPVQGTDTAMVADFILNIGYRTAKEQGKMDCATGGYDAGYDALYYLGYNSGYNSRLNAHAYFSDSDSD